MKKYDRTRLEGKEEKKKERQHVAQRRRCFFQVQPEPQHLRHTCRNCPSGWCCALWSGRSVVHTREFSWRYGPLQWVKDTREKWDIGDLYSYPRWNPAALEHA